MDQICIHDLPTNPDDDYYLLNCFVCKEVSKPGECHLRNYGGTVCFSCRQFFRRSHQGEAHRDFACKIGGNCNVTASNRRKCQKCRYVRCLLAGMCPQAVLTDQQKKYRFQRMIRKRKILNAGLYQGAEQGSLLAQHWRQLSIDEDDPYERLYGKMPKLEPIKKEQTAPIKLIISKGRVLSSNNQNIETKSAIPKLVTDDKKYKNELKRQLVEKQIKTEEEKWPSFLEGKVDILLQTYQVTLTEVSNLDIYFRNLWINQKDVTAFSPKKEVLKSFFEHQKQFQKFAHSQSHFCRLLPGQQKQLLDRNTSLFLQFQIACHLGNKNMLKNIFKRESDIWRYQDLLDKLDAMRMKSLKVGAVLSYILLFDCTDDESAVFRSWQNVNMDDLHILNLVMFQNCKVENKEVLSIEDFIRTLREMSNFFSNNVSWKEFELSTPPIIEPSLKPSVEENLWFQRQMRLTHQSLWSVHAEESVLKEFLFFSIGVCPSLNFMSDNCQAYFERIWRVLELHPEFDQLSRVEKENVVRSRGPAAMALQLARQEVLTSGVEQCQEMFGQISESEMLAMVASMTRKTIKMSETWMKQFGVQIFISEVKKISLADIFQFESEPHVTKFLQNLSRVANRFAHLIRDPIVYKILLLLLLTMESRKFTKFSELHKKYLLIFWRQLKQAYAEKSDYDDFMRELFFAIQCFRLLTDSMLQLLS